MSQVVHLAPFIALTDAAICAELDCSALFDRRFYESCPACGNRTWIYVSSWLNPMREEIRRALQQPARQDAHLGAERE